MSSIKTLTPRDVDVYERISSLRAGLTGVSIDHYDTKSELVATLAETIWFLRKKVGNRSCSSIVYLANNLVVLRVITSDMKDTLIEILTSCPNIDVLLTDILTIIHWHGALDLYQDTNLIAEEAATKVLVYAAISRITTILNGESSSEDHSLAVQVAVCAINTANGDIRSLNIPEYVGQYDIEMYARILTALFKIHQ